MFAGMGRFAKHAAAVVVLTAALAIPCTAAMATTPYVYVGNDRAGLTLTGSWFLPNEQVGFIFDVFTNKGWQFDGSDWGWAPSNQNGNWTWFRGFSNRPRYGLSEFNTTCGAWMRVIVTRADGTTMQGASYFQNECAAYL